MRKAMKRLPWKRFVYEVKPAIGNDLQQAAKENEDEISFKNLWPLFASEVWSIQRKGKRYRKSLNFWPLEKESISTSFNKIASYVTRNQVREAKSVVACLVSSCWAFKLLERDFSQIFLIFKAMSLV